MKHEYIVRKTGVVVEERLAGDSVVRALYSPALENAAWLSRMASSRYVSKALGYLNYDNLLSAKASGMQRFLRESGIDVRELVEDLTTLDTPRKIFERKIRYWQCRPMPALGRCVVCPTDSRVVIGSMSDSEALFVKDKFFEFPELLGGPEARWTGCFRQGDFSVFRLTPEKYHYTHCPVGGAIADIYAIDGRYHSCNPNATVQLLTPNSKNRRVVTIIDTDAPGGTGVGLVAMIEVVALMVGQIEQRYSQNQYDNPQLLHAGMHVLAGCPKALFRPGSSTVILMFEAHRIRFAEDLVRNQQRAGVSSRFSAGFGQAMVESEVAARSLLATPSERS
jgi:phosphatidylserine decarboxylase